MQCTALFLMFGTLMNNRLRTLFTVIVLQAGTLQPLLAAELAAAPVAASNVWIRATVPAQQVTGAFMTLTSVTDLRLVAASSPQAGMVEIHQMSMENNVMQMRALPDGLAVPKGTPVELKAGGFHLMLMNLKNQMKAGARVPLTLTFEAKDKKRIIVKVVADVRDITATGKTDGGMKP